MIEATLTLAAQILVAVALAFAGLAGFAWAVHRYRAEHPNADDYRNRAERAEAALAEALAELDKVKAEFNRWSDRDAKGRFVRREP